MRRIAVSWVPHIAQLRAERFARPRQARADGAERDAKRKRDLFVAQSLDFSQNDRRLLVERQAVERELEPRGELFLPEHAIGRRPGARGRQLAMILDVLVERDLLASMPAPPPPQPVARLVDDDAVNPGLEAGLTAKSIERAEDPEEDFLRQVERFVVVAE